MFKESDPTLVKYLLKANHTSIFEHCSITILISGVSRSFLAQITRHRMASYTSASQHYQIYEDYDDIISEHMKHMPVATKMLEATTQCYQILLKHYDVSPEEARQVLPGAKAVNIMWTINARSLINFLNQRLCNRNVQEMRIFAEKLHDICKWWFPELFNYVGPDCEMLGIEVCRQGKMRAKDCIGRGKTI